MGSRQISRYGISGRDLSHGPSFSSNPSSEWFLHLLRSDIGKSPCSPLISDFDCDINYTLSSSHARDKQPLTVNCLENYVSLRHLPIDLRESLPVATGLFVDRCSTEQNALLELESLLMAPDTDDMTTTYSEFDQNSRMTDEASRRKSPQFPHEFATSRHHRTNQSPRPEKRLRETKIIPTGDVKLLLIECAKALSDGRLAEFEMLVRETQKYVSIKGEPVQRLGAYMLEGLVARQEASGTNIYRALHCWEPESHELLSYMQILYDVCPYFKFGYMAANGAIAEAIKNEDRAHIIDFQIAQGTQWLTLIQALAARPGGPPHVRITGIDDPVSKYAQGDGLELVGRRLIALARKFKIPLEFHAMPVHGIDVTKEMLDIRPGEAVAVNFTLHLHHIPDESVDLGNPRDGLLRMVKGLSPKVTTLVEQESNTNTTPFLTRFAEALDYYSGMFESLDEMLVRDSKDRVNVEQHCLAKDIVNIIACEGRERVERHELLGKWRSRLSMAGFKPFPLSSYMNSVIKSLLRSYSEKYTLVERDGAMLLGWKERNLISASAWH